MIYRFGEFELDTGLFELRSEGKPVPVEPQVFDVLALLVERRDRVVTKEEILEAVWADRFISESTLVSRLTLARKAVNDDARRQRLIRTVHGRGYRFVAAVREEPGVGELPEVGGVGRFEDRGRSVMSGPTPAVIGRESELDVLHRAADTAGRGERRIVFVTGEAGLGKTTVVESFTDRLRADGWWTASGQCLEHSGAGEAYMPVLEALGRLCRLAGPDLVDVLIRRAPTWMAQMPWLLTDEQLDALHRRTATSREERMLREMGEALESVAAGQPILIVLEDLHWSDPSTVDLVAWIAGRSEACRLLLVATYRPEEATPAGRRLSAVHQRLSLRRQATDLVLPALPETAVREYLERRIGGALSASLAPLVLRRAGGNPLFMVNLVEAWMGEGLLAEDDDGEWRLAADLDRLEAGVPETLRKLVDLRLDELPAAEREMLECASVVGGSFSAAAVTAGCESRAAEVERCLARIAADGRFLRAGGTAEWPDGTVAARFEFVHSLYRDVLYEGVSPGRRARLHAAIGERLARAWGDRSGDRASELALHFARGRVPLRAARFFHRAALRALDRSAYREAVTHFESALALLAEHADGGEGDAELELDVRVVYAPTLAAIRGWADPEVERAFHRARDLAERVGDVSRIFPILYGLAGLHELRGEFEACQRALRRHDPDPAWPQLEFHEMMACSVFHQGDPAATYRHAELALAAWEPEVRDLHARAYGESAVVRTHVWMALALWYQGHPDQAVERMRQGLELAEGPDLTYSLSSARSHLALLHQLRREPEPALRWARDTVEVATRHGFAYRVAMGRMIEGWALATDGGEPARGIAALRGGLELADELGVALDRPYFLALLAEACLAGGEIAEGLSALAAASEFVGATRSYFFEPELVRLEGLLLSAEGPARDPEAAEERFRTALSLARRYGSKSLELSAALSLGRCWSRSGRGEEARELVAGVLEWFGADADGVELSAARRMIA